MKVDINIVGRSKISCVFNLTYIVQDGEMKSELLVRLIETLLNLNSVPN